VAIRVAVDAMGGDYAPDEVVAGSLLAAKRLGVHVLLVGREEQLRRYLQDVPAEARVELLHAPDVVEMGEHPTEAVRTKPESSLVKAIRLIKDGQADAAVTCGNTGAAMAAALLVLGRVRGIARPALATVVATGHGGRGMLLDVGANAECRPLHLVQFAHMGAGYMERTYGIERPRVALLSIGEEDTKGNALVLETNRRLRASGLNFIGNVEGKDLPKGVADVVVTDGFTGNVVLKTAEGMAEFLFDELRRAVAAKPWNRLAGLMLLPELRKVRRRLDYTEYGGAPLLGVNGIVVIGHGRSNARAVANAVRVARDAVRNGVLDVVRSVAESAPARVPDGGSEDSREGENGED